MYRLNNTKSSYNEKFHFLSQVKTLAIVDLIGEYTFDMNEEELKSELSKNGYILTKLKTIFDHSK